MSKASEFVEVLRGRVGRSIYVWGGDGELMSSKADPEKWIREHETSSANAERAIALYRQLLSEGITDIRAFDCSGFVFWGLKALGIDKGDLTARGLWQACKLRNDTGLDEANLRTGDFLCHYDEDDKRITHIGVLVDSATSVECIGRDEGVVEMGLTYHLGDYWNRWARWDTFAAEDVEEPAGEPAEETPEPVTVAYVQSLGSVRVRAGGSTAYPKIGTARRGERYLLTGTADTGWHQIDFKGKVGYISCNPKYTRLIEQ